MAEGRERIGLRTHRRAAAAASGAMSVMLLNSACFALAFAWASSSCA